MMVFINKVKKMAALGRNMYLFTLLINTII